LRKQAAAGDSSDKTDGNAANRRQKLYGKSSRNARRARYDHKK
jgi:hypothetical protein